MVEHARCQPQPAKQLSLGDAGLGRPLTDERDHGVSRFLGHPAAARQSAPFDFFRRTYSSRNRSRAGSEGQRRAESNSRLASMDEEREDVALLEL